MIIITSSGINGLNYLTQGVREKAFLNRGVFSLTVIAQW